MRRAIILATLIALAGCTATDVNKPSPSIPASPDTGSVVADAKKFGKKFCSFVPTAKTILEIVDLGLPNISKGVDIAEKICEALKTKGLAAPTVNGVVIHGHYDKS